MDDVEIVDYDVRWPAMFAAEAARVRSTIDGNLITDIHHFGSTAVPGLASKPIIDILIIVRSLESARSVIEPLLALGYVFWEDNPKKDRLFFVKGMPPHGERRTHHIHVAEAGSEMAERLLFRDYLRMHSAEAERYAELKRKLAERYRGDREAYTESKAEYVATIMKKARR